MDTYEGSPGDPPSLHKYTYSNNNPVHLIDPSGNQGDLVELGEEEDVDLVEDAMPLTQPAVAGGAQAVAQAAVVTSQLQVAPTNLLLTSLIVGPIVAAVLPSDGPKKEDQKQKPDNRGRLQVQGADIAGSTVIKTNVTTHPDFVYSGNTLSWQWSQPAPLLASTALIRLNEFLQILSFDQIGRRRDAFFRASRFIVNASLGGGIGPTIVPPFNANDSRYPDARVDNEVQAGRAFVPGP